MMTKYLLILRGVPGSGKTIYANRFAKKFASLFGRKTIRCSADNYFIDRLGIYTFDKNKLWKVHEQCQWNAARAMRQGIDLVIIDNTNTTVSELKPYEEAAKEWGYIVKYKVIGGQSEENVKLYALRNTHGVSIESIRKMANRLSDSLKQRGR